MGEKPTAQPRVGIEVDWTTEPPSVFVDSWHISFRGDAFALVLCEIRPADGTAESKEGQHVLPARPRASIRMAADQFLALTQVMMQLWDQYCDAKQFGHEVPRFRDMQPGSDSAPSGVDRG